MKFKITKHFFITFLAILTIFQFVGTSCTKITGKEDFKKMFDKPYNIVYISAPWCGVSKGILDSTYANISLDTSKYNIILMSVNFDGKYSEKFDNRVNANIYKFNYSNGLSPNGLTDRKLIKKIIKSYFTNYDGLDLGFGFGMPISFVADSNLKIFITNLPQDTTSIKRVLESYERQVSE